MQGLIIALVFVVAIAALVLRDNGRNSAWRPASDWRERDPRS